MAKAPSNNRQTPVDLLEHDKPFLTGLDDSIRQFVTAVQKLKAAKDDEQKVEFITLAGFIFTRVDALLDGVLEYYLFKSVDDEYRLEPDRPKLKREFYTLKAALLTVGNELMLKSKLASGVWPPPNANEDMMKSAMDVAAHVKQLRALVDEAVKALRATEDETRRKMEAHMGDWNQSAHVRSLFNQFEVGFGVEGAT